MGNSSQIDFSQPPPSATEIDFSQPPPTTQFERERNPKNQEGVLSTIGGWLERQIPHSLEDYGKAIMGPLVPGLQLLQTNLGAALATKEARERGHGIPYSVDAGLASGLGIDAESMERAADVGNVRGIVGEAAVPTALAVAGPLVHEATTRLKATPVQITKTLGISDPEPLQLLTKAVKPLASNTGWDAAIAKAAPDIKSAEQQLGRPVQGVDDALEATTIAKRLLWRQYEAKLNQAQTTVPQPGGPETYINGNEIADAMMKSIDARTKVQNPALVDKITKVADTYRRGLPLDEAEDFLQSANNDLHNYYAKNKVGRQVAQGDPEIGSVVAEADQLRQSLYSKLDALTGPGAADLKQRYGALSNVEAELLRRKNVAARQQPESLAEQLSMARAYGKIIAGAYRLSPSSIIEGTQSLAASKFLKERGTTDAMISRAFEKLGAPQAQPAPKTNVSPITLAAPAGGFRAGTQLSALQPVAASGKNGNLSELLNP